MCSSSAYVEVSGVQRWLGNSKSKSKANWWKPQAMYTLIRLFNTGVVMMTWDEEEEEEDVGEGQELVCIDWLFFKC